MLTRVMGRPARLLDPLQRRTSRSWCCVTSSPAAKQPQVVLDRSRRPQRAEQAAPSAAAPAAAGL